MTDGDFDFLGQAYWRKRIHQLKLELRSAASGPSLSIPEAAKAYGTELKPKRDRHGERPAIPKREIASEPPRQRRSSYSG